MSAITYGPAVITAPLVVTRLRLTRRGRAVIALLVSLPLVVALVSMALNGGGATATPPPTAIETITVEAGESLWSVAALIAPEASTADVVADLIAVNDLSSAELVPGQVLVVPSRYAG
ncbi:LysM peptidoglycan-binding domain-containing protein [Microcella sp.]|uniref:LysM peptidoglycan-binding domain-containing protein n=1 Tax=Microcella sp. TaxID=1913979 RepID=UPI00391A1AF0